MDAEPKDNPTALYSHIVWYVQYTSTPFLRPSQPLSAPLIRRRLYCLHHTSCCWGPWLRKFSPGIHSQPFHCSNHPTHSLKRDFVVEHCETNHKDQYGLQVPNNIHRGGGGLTYKHEEG